ncbi:MAG: hypothetical protein R3Y36_08350 [Spirochaetales bacterium]
MSQKHLLNILIPFAQKQKSPLIHFTEFCDYMRRYAQHNIDVQPNLAEYATNTENALLADIEKSDSLIVTNDTADKRMIVVIPAYADRYATRYREIPNNLTLPFPIATDLPKRVPAEAVIYQPASTFLPELFEQEEKNKSPDEPIGISVESKKLYGLTFADNIPALLLPSTISVTSLFEVSFAKIRNMLRKEEFHDYFLKRLQVANGGKELSVKNFFTQFVQKPADSIESVKTAGDAFYFWNQLGYFIRQDYEKVTDYTPEHISILQSVAVSDISIGYYKNKSQQNLQKTTALKNLELALDAPPFYFTLKDIELFTDTHGIPLLGRYSQEDLKNYLNTATTSATADDLPALLTFKIYTGERYYIYRSKIIPLIVRLCNDARETIKKDLTSRWLSLYKKFDVTPAMNDQKAFETCLENEVKSSSPILYALLQSNFLPFIHGSDKPTGKNHLFADGELKPYSQLLMLSRREIATDAKIILPVWYTLPIVSWIARLFLGSPKRKKAKSQIEENSVPTAQLQLKTSQDQSSGNSTKNIRRQEFRSAAAEAEAKIVPPNSNIDREMDSYTRQWNQLLDKQLNANLTEDVNSLIRDYMRKTLRTIKSSSFSLDRMKNLADTLMQNPALQKIKDKDSLKMYIVLYIIRLTKTL